MHDPTDAAARGQTPEIVFWLNSLSIHQAPVIRAISAQLGTPAVVVADADISTARRAQGWTTPDHGDAMVWTAPTVAERRSLIERCDQRTAHVFSGLGVSPTITQSMLEVAQTPHRHIAVVSEPWNPAGVRGLGRLLAYRSRRRTLGSAIDSILAIGPLASSQFAAAGFAPSRVHPYAYFVESGRTQPLAAQPRAAPVELGFVGQLIPRKNVSLLLRALTDLRELSWHLRVVGSGVLRESLETESRERGLAGRISFTEPVSNASMPALLSTLDLLVLPSVFDGWGAVVSEALDAGTRVCVSDAAGSSDLVRGPAQGSVFASEDVASLRSHLRAAIESGPPPNADRTALSRWARAVISPEAGARYLWSILSSDPGHDAASIPPWHSAS